MGLSEYEPLVEQYQVPIVATGFEPLDVLEGSAGWFCNSRPQAQLDNAYPRAVQPQGNPCPAGGERGLRDLRPAMAGIGMIPQSGWRAQRRLRGLRRREALEVLASPPSSRRCAGRARYCRV